MAKYSSKKYFLMSMAICFFFLLLIMGITVVEKNGKSLISGENLSLVSFKRSGWKLKFFKIHFMGQDFTLNFE